LLIIYDLSVYDYLTYLLDNVYDVIINRSCLTPTFSMPKISNHHNEYKHRDRSNSCRGVIALFNRYEDPVYLYQPLKGEYIVIPPQSKDKSKDKCSLFMVEIRFEPT
jgi:hypothetical protein